MEAVKQGTPVLGLRSDTHVVLASFKKAGDMRRYTAALSRNLDQALVTVGGLCAPGNVEGFNLRSLEVEWDGGFKPRAQEAA